MQADIPMGKKYTVQIEIMSEKILKIEFLVAGVWHWYTRPQLNFHS